MRFNLYFFILLFLAGCGSDSNRVVPEEYTGIWSDTQVINQIENEKYILIEGNGDVTYYDYLGDAYDQGQNCFIVIKQGQLTPIEANLFEYAENELLAWVKLTIIENVLNLLKGDVGSTFESAGSYGIAYRYYPTNINKSDLTPLCQA